MGQLSGGAAKSSRPVALLQAATRARAVRRPPKTTANVNTGGATAADGYCWSSILRTCGTSASETIVAVASPRFRPGAFLVRMWRFIDLLRLILPLAVILKRFTAPRFVFSFSFFFGFFMFP